MAKRIRKQLLGIGILVVSMCVLAAFSYDVKFVEVSTVKQQNSEYKTIYLKRDESGKRIKAKYFAAKDLSGVVVPERYKTWAKYKNIICVTSGTYMDNYSIDLAKPVGLTIDNGVIVNRSITEDKDALVIVYATGGIVASNLKDKDLTVQGGEINNVKLDLRGNSFHRTKFIDWAKDQTATVFQTHLLVYKNTLKIDPYNSSQKAQERRFLAVGTDENGKVVHAIVHSPEVTTLYNGAKKVLNFLNSYKEMQVTFMVNLDTGAQDVFNLFDDKGAKNNMIQGQKRIEEAVNLLVYYYE